MQFNPISSLQSGSHGYKERPSLDDKVHVLVCVLSANMTNIKESHLQKMADVREAASDLGTRTNLWETGTQSHYGNRITWMTVI